MEPTVISAIVTIATIALSPWIVYVNTKPLPREAK